MSCPHCGSWAVRSDRSLAGRLVCGRCGQPLTGGGARRSPRRRSGRGPLRPSTAPRRWGLVLLLLLLSGAWLAAQPPLRQPGSPPADRPGLRSGGRI